MTSAASPMTSPRVGRATAATAVLWLGPALLLAVALAALALVIRHRSRLADDHFEADPVFEGDVPEISPDPMSRPGTPA